MCGKRACEGYKGIRTSLATARNICNVLYSTVDKT